MKFKSGLIVTKKGDYATFIKKNLLWIDAL